MCSFMMAIMLLPASMRLCPSATTNDGLAAPVAAADGSVDSPSGTSNNSWPRAMSGLTAFVVNRVSSSARIRSTIARPRAAPSGLAVSGISLPIE